MASTQESVVRSRVDKRTKEKAEKIIGKLGLNMSDAIRIYLKQIINHKGLPFDMKLPSATTVGALQEDMSKKKRYSSMNEFWDDMDIDLKDKKKK